MITVDQLIKLGFVDDSKSFAEPGNKIYSYYFKKFNVALVIDLTTSEMFIHMFDPEDKKENLNIALPLKQDINYIKNVVDQVSKNELNLSKLKLFSNENFSKSESFDQIVDGLVKVIDTYMHSHNLESSDGRDSWDIIIEARNKLMKKYSPKFKNKNFSIQDKEFSASKFDKIIKPKMTIN